MAQATKRYGGMLVADGLKHDAPYYLVTQVRGVSGTRPNHRKCLKTLGLGRIGKCRVVPNAPSVIGAVQKVDHLVVVMPLKHPSEASAVQVLGSEHCVIARPNGSQAAESAGTGHPNQVAAEAGLPSLLGNDADEGGKQAVKTLKDVIKDLHRLVLPKLTDDQLDATASMTAEAIEAADGKPLDAATSRKLTKNIRDTIDQRRPPGRLKST